MNHRILPEAARAGTPIRVIVMAEPDIMGAFPVLVTASPTIEAGARYDDLQSLVVIANALRLEVRRRVDRYMNWPHATSNARTTGILIMENWNNEGHRATRNNVTLRNLNGELMFEMFESVNTFLTLGSSKRIKSRFAYCRC